MNILPVRRCCIPLGLLIFVCSIVAADQDPLKLSVDSRLQKGVPQGTILPVVGILPAYQWCQSNDSVLTRCPW